VAEAFDRLHEGVVVVFLGVECHGVRR
jgi:hypothetical protein